MRGAFDGTGNQQGKEAHEETVINEVLFGFNALFINVDDVRQSMERLKRDAHGKDDLEGMHAHICSHHAQHIGKRLREEVVVFEYA